ncbi:MAG: acyl-CoA dehydratase activase-related protein, partial [Bacilli bacterium]
ILTSKEIENLTIKSTHTRCKKCENNCLLTVNIFNKQHFISGNRCEKGSTHNRDNQTLPNMYKYKYDRLFNYQPTKNSKRGKIGIPRVLNMYELYPFWFTLFTNLGFEVIISDHSNRKIYEKGIESMPSESVCFPAKLVHGHMINLIEKNIKTIFYPCIMYEISEFKTSDNHYNCPIVTSYPEAIKLNIEKFSTNNITYINPFLPMDEKGLFKRIIEIEEFKQYNFETLELKQAIKEAFIEQNKFKQDIIKKGQEIIAYINKNNKKAVVLAGRPYHLDKEINHGIDTMINSLGLAVLTEDAICHMSKIATKLRVIDQWSYHSRVYHAADVVSRYDNMELVNLNSFGCGLDAIITDQTDEILKKNGKLYTTIKIDEINNLGAAKIRIRSLIASMNKRTNNINYKTYTYHKNSFTKEMKTNHTILVPDMTPFHMNLLASAFSSSGYNIVYLNETTDEMIDYGLKYVNNDACYPALIVIGQLLYALKSNKYDLENTSIIISQTGGGCRATNYIGLIRKALKDANLEKIPIISFNLSGLEKNQGFKIT